MPLDATSVRSDGLEDFPTRFDENWTNYDAVDQAALRHVLPGLGFNEDDNTVYFARALDYVKARAYTRLLPPLAGDKLVPTATDTPAWASSVTYRVYDEVGMAKIIANYADDLPRVDVRGKEVTVPVRGIGDSYGYNTQDLRVALANRTGLPTLRADTARKAVQRKENSLKIRGDLPYLMYGITNHPNISLAVPTTGNWGAVATTGDQMLADVNVLINAVVNQSNGLHTPNVIGMTNIKRAQLATKRLSGAAQIPVLNAVHDQYPSLNIVVAQEMKGAGANGGDLLFAAEYDVDNYYYDQAMPFEQHPPQARNLEFVVNCEARAAGLIMVRPLCAATMEGV